MRCFPGFAARNYTCKQTTLYDDLCDVFQCLRQRFTAADALSRPQAASSHAQQYLAARFIESIALHLSDGIAVDLLPLVLP